VGDLAYAQTLCDQLGEIFCLIFVKGVDESDALLRMGGYPDTVETRTAGELAGLMGSFDAGFPTMAVAVALGPWSVVIEPRGFHGAGHPVLGAASRGTEAISVLRHDYASAHFAYAVNGTIVTGFEPGYPVEELMHGSDPRRLREPMRLVGLRPPTDEEDDTWEDAVARAVVLAQRITGVTVPHEPLLTARLSAHLEPWFVTPASGGDLLYADRLTPHAIDLVTAAEAAPAHVQRAVAVAEARRQAAALGIADTPGLAQALADAAHGTADRVTTDSPLGRHVRMWLDAQNRASVSTNGPFRGRLSDDERRHAFGLGWFVVALRGVLEHDPRVALLAALRPLTSGIDELGNDEARNAVVRALRGMTPPGTY
jgi:hypothetical protein